MSLVTGFFFPVLLLNQRWSPPLRLQASHCSTFRIMCDVPSIAVICSESIECFPGTAPIFFLKLLVTIPLAPIIAGTTVHFRFHIRCISIHKLCILTSFPLPFAQHFCLRFLPHLSVCMYSLLFSIIMSGLFAVTSLCVLLYYYYYYYYYYYLTSETSGTTMLRRCQTCKDAPTIHSTCCNIKKLHFNHRRY